MSALSILAEECELLNDSKYRSYITQVEKALKSFDSTSEWADLISALAKLNKVLLAHVRYPVIPKRVTIGKRLAQCLHPALPSGVHMKALETYDIIFKCIGTERLAQDLFIYSAGLFPLLSYAAMNVKPVLLVIYERHFVGLGKRIKPGLNGLLLGLLPGLEEGSEYYDHTNAIMEDFCECTEPSYFFTCLWECVHSCPSVRLPAVTYLLAHFNKKQTMEDQLYMIGLNISLMIEGICNCVQDSSVLVQRSLLDFLILAFPLHNSQLTRSDMAKIVQAATNVLLRRDMSLNRRFYAWLLGTSPSTSAAHTQMIELRSKGDKTSEGSETELSYFEEFSRELLVQALKIRLGEKVDLNSVGGKTAILKPFRILISLLDKPEIGPVILENVLLSIFRCLFCEFENSKLYGKTVPSNKRGKTDTSDKATPYEELLKTANLLFGTFEPYFIWDYVARMFEQTCRTYSEGSTGHRQSFDLSRQESRQEISDNISISELCQLVSFLLEIISLETFSETQTDHLPSLLCNIIVCLTDHCSKLLDKDIIVTLQLCTKILSKVQPTMTITGSHDVSPDASHDQVEGEVSSIEKPPAAKPLSLEEALEMNRKLKSENEDEQLQKDTSSSNGASPEEQIPDNQKGEPDKTVNKTSTNTVPPSKDPVSNNVQDLAHTQATAYSSDKQALSRTNSKAGQSANVMQNCIEHFQHFFHTILTQKLFGEEKVARRCFQSLLLTSDLCDSYPTMDKDSCLDSGSEFSYDDRFSEDGTCVSVGARISVSHVDEEWLWTFSSACQLLVEFASFPMYGQEVKKADKQDRDDCPLPCWVQDLVACCCFVDSYHIQSAAISTMLDLIILTQSVQVESSAGNQWRQEGLVSAQILPTLHHSDLQVLEEQTIFYKMSAGILWSYLGDSTPQYHQLAVKLFHILHQVSPCTWVCENVIGNQLVSDHEKTRIDAFKKFSVLWHLTRNRKSGIIPGKPLRTFDRSMFVVLDSLKEDSSPVRSIAVTWLTHVIRQGDLGRIMEPLLLMLLHPDTARVSIQHVNIHKPRKVRLSECSDDNTEANIYAISSEGGNVIYHVNPAKANPKSQMREDLKSYALTVLGNRGTQTAPVRAQSDQELHFEKVDPNNLSLRINPFGSENSLDKLIYSGFDFMSSSHEHVYGAKRLDKEICKKEGISFVERDESTQGDDVDEELKLINTGKMCDSRSSMNASCDSIVETSEDIVRSLLDSLVQGVVGDDPMETSTQSISSQLEDRRPKAPMITRTDSLCSSNAGEHDLFNAMNKSGSGVDSPTPSEQNVSIFQDIRQGDEKDTTDIHTLHMHMLLYTKKYDYERTLYALSTLKAMLVACPRMTVTSLVTTNISSLRAPQLAKLQLLLARHRKSVFGKNFFGEIPAEVMSNYRSSMFIEILLSVCMYFMRGYYPNLMMSKLSYEDLLGNKQVHIIATETFTLMLSEVVDIMRDSGKNFVSYISDLMQRCKVQKALLHCMLAVIYNNRKKKVDDKTPSKITETIISFNEDELESSANETFQIKLLEILLVLIKLEDQIGKFQGKTEPSTESDWNRLKINYQSSLNNVKYNLGHPIVQQAMFVSGVLSALKQYHMCHMHQHWVAMVTAALPYMGKYLPGLVMAVVSQLCRNLEALAGEYERDGKASASSRPLEKIPPDHVVNMLDGLMTLCHYCLLDSVSPVAIGQTSPSGTASGQSAIGSTNILTNLFHVFNPSIKETSPQRDTGTISPVMDARSNILSILPRITACLTSMWRAINIVEDREDSPTLTIGAPRVVRQFILEFLSPISLPHGTHLLGAIAVAWNDRRKKHGTFKNNKRVIPAPCEDQLLLVDLIEAIRVLPMDTLIQTVKQVLKNPPSSELNRGKKNVPLEVNMLQFFYAYVEKATVSQLVDSWPALLSLLREALQLPLIAPGQFLLLLILNEFVMKTPAMSDKKGQKELQEMTQRLSEAVSGIAGACLEQTAWLRKNYAVKPGLQSDEPEAEDGNQEEEEAKVTERRVVDPEPSSSSSADGKYSVQALTLLAELTAPMLDVIYSSEEKDKVAPFLTTLLYNVFPYLKSHSSNNLPSLRAGSQFLASISSYQYTRKAWRREALDLLLDSSFFQMDMTSINCWLTIVDNLMTHDKTTYKDLMARVSMTQSASLNLFSNKEQEMDLKASMLKRLAFTVFCSEPDQYQKSIPEIQEKLAESLRVLQAPSVMAQVFNCFRVLLLRVSPQHLTSMWPTIITELIHVFLQIEQELSTETEEFMTQVQRIAALDSSWAHLGNGLNAHNNPSWLQLYLSACKLLDLCLALPADKVPQFQLYRWAFIGGAAAGESEEDMDEDDEVTKKKKEAYRLKTCFKPHIIRLARLLNTKLQGDVPVMKMTPGRPLLTICYLRSLTELQPFFNTLCLANQTDNLIMAARQLGPNNNIRNPSVQMTNGHAAPRTANQSAHSLGVARGIPKSKSAPVIDPSQSMLADFSSDIKAKTSKQFIEEILKRDFLEPMS